MQKIITRYLLILLGFSNRGFCQTKDSLPVFRAEDSSRIRVRALALNSDKSDFSPQLVNNTLMFVSSRPAKTGLYYTNELNTELTDLFYAVKRDSLNFGPPRPLSKVINTKYNEGPFTLSKDGNTIYFSGNTKNKKRNRVPERLQIHCSKKVKGVWTMPEAATFCDPDYSNCHPAYSGDNRLLIFCSDMPGGYGGTDLYCTRLENNAWTKPVNLGPGVNSAANELFPFVWGNSILYFSSNRVSGPGGLDLYVTDLSDSMSRKSNLLDAPFNTAADDFGLWLDSTKETGYFSSNRLRNNDEIFYFTTVYPDFKNAAPPPVKTKFCYSFFEENAYPQTDSVNMTYEWDFGNGHKIRSEKCRYCFDQPGEYAIRLNVVEKNSGEIFYNQVTYTLTVEEPQRLVIACDDTVPVNSEVVMDARRSGIRGYQILDCYWAFGDGTYNRGPLVKHTYRKTGSFAIELGVNAKNEVTQKTEKFKISKTIVIKDNPLVYDK